ncbi:MAG: histidine phosphatase family protein [Clostridia bacterium]|nr:histidine phosphatase family protein [Clostridia bacterium]
MELYIIRHGDPDYANDTLTEKGWEEAKKLGPRMAALHPVKIFASPRKRAQDTAKPACELLGQTFQVEDWMNESMDYMQSLGDDEASVANYDVYGYRTTIGKGCERLKDFAPSRTEALDRMIANSDDFFARLGFIREGLRYRAADPVEGNVLCFCHGGFGTAWIGHLLGMDPAYTWLKLDLFTTAVTRFTFMVKDGYAIPRMRYLGDTSHLTRAPF